MEVKQGGDLAWLNKWVCNCRYYIQPLSVHSWFETVFIEIKILQYYFKIIFPKPIFCWKPRLETC